MSKYRAGATTHRKPGNAGRSLVRRFLADESGNVILWVCAVMLTMLFICAFAIDLVHAQIVEQQLQASADAAALAAAEDPSNYPTVGHTYTLGSSNAGGYSAGSGAKNTYTGISLSTNMVTPLCLSTVAGWSKSTCASGSAPNAMQVTQAATIPTYFAQIFGWTSFTPSVVSTATVQGASPLPYNVAILVDSTLSMNSTDGGSTCGSLTQEQCALQGVQALLGSGGSGSYGLAPSVDNVALFTFPNVATGSTAGIVDSSGAYQCTTNMPQTYKDPTTGVTTTYQNGSRQGYGYYSMLYAYWSNSKWGSPGNGYPNPPNNIPYPGVAWGMPYSFPPIPSGSSASYAVASGTLGPTYEVVPFSNDYRTSDSATTLNSSSNLVEATGYNSGCGGIQPSNFDGNYGTYYAGAMYAAQAALVAEQAQNGYPNVMIILGDGNNNGPSDQQAPDGQTPSVSSTTAEIASTYLSPTQLTYSPAGNTAAYTPPSGYSVGSSNGTYPSWVGTCGQAVTAANYIKTYSPRSTAVYTVAYGSPSTSSSSNCGYDLRAGAYPNITPCNTMKWMATGGSSSESAPSNFFYSDYDVSGGDSNCVSNSSNQTNTSLVDIFHSIASSLTRVRLIPNNTQ